MSAATGALTRYAAPLVAGLATCSTLATIGPVFSNQRWLLTSITVVAVIVLSGIGLRAVGVAQAYVSLIQLVLGIYALLLLTCQPTMIAGFIPSGDSFAQLISLIGDGAHTARTKVAPITPTAGTATLLALLVTPVAVLVDDCAVTGRPALAGIPLLTLFAICSAIVRHPISMWLVIIPVAAFLLLLWLAEVDSGVRRGLAGAVGGLASSALIAVLAMAIAAAVTVVVRLPDGGVFAVSGNKDRSPNETVARSTDLIGQLSRDDPLPLFNVKTDDPAPFYLRTIVLESWGERGWSFTNAKDSGVDPANIPQGATPNATATTKSTITVEKYSDVFAPTYYAPTSIDLPGVSYDSAMSVVFTADKGVLANESYEVTSAVPRPTPEELAAVVQSPEDVPGAFQRDLVVPGDVDPSVVALTQEITGAAGSPWEVAVALDAFFSDPAQGFTYSLDVPDPQGADPLASFLEKRRGFCEQYASAMAGMFRIAEVPARVVIGYTKGKKLADESYAVTTDEAHAWVEAYFGDVGWVSFDPTPIGERAVPLPYVPSDQIDPTAPQPSAPAQPTGDELPSEAAPTTAAPEQPSADGLNDGASTAWVNVLRWLLIAVLALAVVSLPGVLRERRWRSRLAAAAGGGRGGASSAWAEISELAADLGHPATPSLSESAQARRWAADFGIGSGPVEDLGVLAERARYAGDENVPPTDGQLSAVRRSIRAKTRPAAWWRAKVLPSAVRSLRRR